jgi:hypothetical protein
MQSGNGVGAAREFQTENGHAEVLALVPWILPAQLHQLVLGNAERVAHRPQVLLHQVGVEPVVTGGHRSVRSENRLPRNPADRMIETDSLALHAVANGFQNSEPAVTFIQVQNTGRDAHGFEGAETSDAEQQFLANPDARVSSI